jgi:competence protein ComEC
MIARSMVHLRRDLPHETMSWMMVPARFAQRLCLVALGFGFGTGCAADDDVFDPGPVGSVVLRHWDVGQADATLIESPEGTILIDAGHWEQDDVVGYLEAARVRHIDLLVLTHPHADHIGQVAHVMDAFPVTEVWMSGWQHESATFNRVMDAVTASDAALYQPRVGDVASYGDLHVEVVNPESPLEDIHDNIAVRIVFRAFSAVYTGDAEAEHEAEMIGRDLELEATVLQLGHHGSRTSSSRAFVEAVDPEVAIYSAARDSQYGHPHTEVVRRFEEYGIPLYGTAEHGTIVITSDGARYDVSVARQSTLGPGLELSVAP